MNKNKGDKMNKNNFKKGELVLFSNNTIDWYAKNYLKTFKPEEKTIPNYEDTEHNYWFLCRPLKDAAKLLKKGHTISASEEIENYIIYMIKTKETK